MTNHKGQGPSLEARRAGGRRSAQVRKEKARLKADVRAKLKFEQAAEKMAQVIIDAALGDGDFARLDPKERAQFAVKALEYGVGRPRPEKDTPPASEPDAGLSISFGSPQGELITTPPADA